MTHRLLIICYYFPPLGLAGVGRPLNLFKYLPNQGWDCHILTVKPVTYRGYEPELLEGVDQGRIFRAGSYDPQRLMYLAGWRKVSTKTLESGLKVRTRFFPDSKRGWIGPAVRLGKKLIERFDYDLIMSSAPPMSAHLVGMRLHESTGIKWVADFRDYWTSSTIEETYDDVKKVDRARVVLESISSRAAAVTAVNRSVGEYVGARHVITNGFDAANALSWQTPSADDRFSIGLLGTFGSINPVEPLFKVIQELRQTSPEQADRIDLVQVGNVEQEKLLSLADKYGLKQRCRCYGLRPRIESISLLRECSCLYQSILPSWGAGMTPARLFDMMASGRPILAFAEENGEVEKVVRPTKNGFCFTDDQIKDAADYLGQLIAARMAGTLKITPLPPYSEPYRWERIAGEFASLFNSLL